MSNHNPELDLVIERQLPYAAQHLWDAWTVPAEIVQWFTPAPWSTSSAIVDLKPGGQFTVTMCDPDGQEYPNDGCFLEVAPNERLVWTNALYAGYRPAPAPTSPEQVRFTAEITLTPNADGTHYRVVLRHPDEATKKGHEDMGFDMGWNAALDQLVEKLKAQGL